MDSILYSPASSDTNVRGFPKPVVDPITVQRHEAKSLEQEGRLQEALIRYQAIVETYQDHPLAGHALTRVYSIARNTAQDMRAFAAYFAGVEQGTTNPDIYRHARGWRLRCLVDAGDVETALAGYRAIANIATDSTERMMARVNIADIYHHALGDLQRAANEYAAIVADAPEHTEAEVAQMALADLSHRSMPAMPVAARPEQSDDIPEVMIDNAPNPFNPTTTIRLAVPQETFVELAIFNMLGQPVRMLLNGHMPRGAHEVVWDGRDDGGRKVASGLYLCHLTIGKLTAMRKMLLVR